MDEEFKCPFCDHICDECLLVLGHDAGLNHDYILCTCGKWRALPEPPSQQAV
jgi:hypothetical protein